LHKNHWKTIKDEIISLKIKKTNFNVRQMAIAVVAAKRKSPDHSRQAMGLKD
jgi:hypothetical protein